MLAFLISVVYLLGLLSGVILTVTLAVNIDARADRKMRKAAQKELAETTKNSTILDYTNE